MKWVINTGSQDHRWLSNDYFASKGAEIMSFGAISILGVVIDNKVVHACDVPNQKSIQSWLSGNEMTETENSDCCDVGKCCQEQKVYE